MTTDNDTQCCATFYPNGSYHRSQCSRKGSVERDGKWYCKTHDPEAVKKRDEMREKRYEYKWEIERLERKIRHAEFVLDEFAFPVSSYQICDFIKDCKAKIKKLEDGLK